MCFFKSVLPRLDWVAVCHPHCCFVIWLCFVLFYSVVALLLILLILILIILLIILLISVVVLLLIASKAWSTMVYTGCSPTMTRAVLSVLCLIYTSPECRYNQERILYIYIYLNAGTTRSESSMARH